MARATLRVVEEPLAPDAKVVVALGGTGGPVLSGGGRASFRCGACGALIARRVDPADLRGLVLRCSTCCRYNTPA